MTSPVANRLLDLLTTSRVHVASLFFLCFTFSYIDRQVVAILVVPLQNDLSLSDSQIGLLQGFSFTLCYATAGVLVAYLVDRTHRVRLVAACVAIWSISTMLCGFADNFPELLVARAGTAIAEAGISPAAISIFSDIYSPRRIARANSLFMLGPYIGGGVALLGGGFLLDFLARDGVSAGFTAWQKVFFIVGLPGLVLAALVASCISEPPRQSHVGNSNEIKSSRPLQDDETPSFVRVVRELVVVQRFCVPYFLGYMSLIALFYSYSAWYPTVLIRHFGLSVAQAGGYAGPVFIFGGVSGVISAGLLIRHLVDRDAVSRALKLSMQASFALVPVASLSPLVHNLSLSLLCYGLTAFAASIVMALAPLPVQVALPNRMRGRAIALLVFLTNAISGGIGPYAVGAINTASNAAGDHIHEALALVAGIAALGSAVLYRKAVQQTLNGQNHRMAGAETEHTAD